MNLAWRRRKPSAASCNPGFTLVEVLAVLIVIVLFVAFFLPTFHRPRPGLQVRCLSNLKQMGLGWVLYYSDLGDRLITNFPYGSSAPLPTNNWVVGVMDWTSNPQNTNADLLLVGALGTYLKSPGVYRCPDDKSESAGGPRVRSYAMNGFMGNGGVESTFPGWKQCLKSSDIQRPASQFVFADEHANSIDDGFFINNPNQSNAWTDLPASGHLKGAAGFGFADGHSEIHRWVDASTRQPMKRFGSKPSVKLTKNDSGADLAWVLNATATRNPDSTNEPAKLEQR